jgi:8-oxo-dGTP pyrophosphatase MutT (NUDIX family)
VPAEISSGGVLVRKLKGEWVFAAIRPNGKPEGVWALPKGLVHRGESAEATALREVAEETGVEGRSVAKLGDVRYVYTRDGRRIFKVVSFYLMRYSRGRLDALAPEQRREVAEARWLPLADAERLLAYRGEREMAGNARVLVEADAL